MYQGAQWKGQHVAITTSITTSIINGVRAIEEQGHREDYRVPLPVPYASERHSGIQNILTAVIKNTLVRLVVRTPPPEDEAAQSGPTTLDRGLVRPCGLGGVGGAEPVDSKFLHACSPFPLGQVSMLTHTVVSHILHCSCGHLHSRS